MNAFVSTFNFYIMNNDCECIRFTYKCKHKLNVVVHSSIKYIKNVCFEFE